MAGNPSPSRLHGPERPAAGEAVTEETIEQVDAWLDRDLGADAAAPDGPASNAAPAPPAGSATQEAASVRADLANLATASEANTSLLDGLPVPAAAIDSQGRLMDANRKWFQILDRTMNATDTWLDQIDPDDAACLADDVNLCGVADTTVRWYDQGGGMRWIRFQTVNPVEGLDHAIWTAEDATERVLAIGRATKLEMLLARTRAELESDDDSREQGGNTIAVLSVSFDGLSELRQQFGGMATELALRALRHRVAEAVRDCDHLSQPSGDAFFVGCAGLHGVENALAIGRRLDALVDRAFEFNEHLVELRLSIGIGAADSEHAEVDDLMSAAVTARHRATEAGLAIEYCSATDQNRRRMHAVGSLVTQ
ncbi:MAG: diguanylate cyclase [Acidimicrobiales bacterium]|nr:diguanylate cyclase [Acidimicrobiales bacterium]